MFTSRTHKKYFFVATMLGLIFFFALFFMSSVHAEACPADNPNCNSLECTSYPCTPQSTELLPGGCITLPIGLEIGLCPPEQTFGGYLQRMYGFLLAFVGIAAFGGITYGGLLYVFAAGSIGKVDEAKKWIWNALIGLLVTAISFILLSTINPNLVNTVSIDLCKYVPSACSTAPATTPGTPPGAGSTCGVTLNVCPSGYQCVFDSAGNGTCQQTGA